MLRLRIDDPLDAVAVHMGGGCLGVLCVPFFRQVQGVVIDLNQNKLTFKETPTTPNILTRGIKEP